MKLRSLPILLLSTSSLLFYLSNLCNSVAPDDLPSNCPAVSGIQRALLDSCCYSNLLLPSGRWSAADQDRDGMTWTETPTGDISCPQSVMVNNASDDWLITQYINTTLSNGITAIDLDVDIQFTCTGNCSSNLDLFYHPTNIVLSQSELVALQDNSFMRIAPVINGSNPVSGITTPGFYLAIRAIGDISVTVNRISIITTVCGEETVNLINFPEAYARATSMNGSCSTNSEPSGSEPLTGTCGNDGMWTASSLCNCSAGYSLNNDACTDCVVNFFLAGGSCMQCPENSMSSGGTTDRCTCIMNHTTMNSSTTTTGESCVCRENYHIDSSNQCVQCPTNSMRPITSPSSTCMCEPNRRTADGNTITSGTVACDGCEYDYFLENGMCLTCPENSNNSQPLSDSCTCKGESVTPGLMSTTSMNSCSTCLVNWMASSMSPLVCMMCQDRSERPVDANIDACTCVTGYEMKSSDCLARVIIPQKRLTLKEGSVENPAEIRLNLSADSYGFNVSYNIRVEQMQLSPTETVSVAVDTREVIIKIPGDDVALNSSHSITVNIQSGNRYIGEGAVEATIVDDDYVSVGFLDSQRTMFNESDDTIRITLTKNATTAQEMQVNVVVPQGSSVSVDNPVILRAGPPDNVSVVLRIQNDVIGSEEDESVTLELELVSPMDFSGLIDLRSRGSGVTNQLTIVIRDDDPPQTPSMVLNLVTIIGIAVAGAAILILIVLICLVSICICRCNANRQGFYITEEDKTTNPPTMLRYSASLRSISSQAVVPIIDGKGQLAEKENEFYV